MAGITVLESHKNIFAKQSRKGCLRTCLGCDARVEIHLATKEQPEQDILYAKEESGFCCRLCFATVHPFEMNVTLGGKDGGPLVAKYERPLACPMANTKCCCFQQIKAFDANGAALGTFTETCWWCVPGFNSVKADGTVQYKVHMPTCCCGTQVNCCAAGCCSCKIPFYIYPPDVDSNLPNTEVGKITRLWTGFGNLLVGLSKFEIEFPADADAESKARLLGGMFLLNEIYFRNPEQGGDA